MNDCKWYWILSSLWSGPHCSRQRWWCKSSTIPLPPLFFKQTYLHLLSHSDRYTSITLFWKFGIGSCYIGCLLRWWICWSNNFILKTRRWPRKVSYLHFADRLMNICPNNDSSLSRYFSAVCLQTQIGSHSKTTDSAARLPTQQVPIQ